MKVERLKGPASSALAALVLLAAIDSAHAQEDAASADSAVTVVTLYSTARPGNEGSPNAEKSEQPIKIVNGGVKSAGASCWKLSNSGKLTTVSGDCYVLRSAELGEKSPSQ